MRGMSNITVEVKFTVVQISASAVQSWKLNENMYVVGFLRWTGLGPEPIEYITLL
jgi:hypothetical protein